MEVVCTSSQLGISLTLAQPYRVKQLKEEPYTQKEAEAAIGLRTDNEGPSKTTQAQEDDEMTMAT